MMTKNTLFLLLPALLLASCARNHLATADRAYDRMAYTRATQEYEKALGRITDREAMLRAADSYRRRNMHARAEAWFARAERIAPLSVDDALHHARTLHALGRTDEARARALDLLTEHPDHGPARELLKGIVDRERFFADSALYAVEELHVPGMASLFSAVPYPGGILFAGEKAAAHGKRNPWNGLSFLDLYTARSLAPGLYDAPQPLPGTVNGRFHEGPATLSADGRVMYFTRSDYYKFRLNKDDDAVSHLKLFRAERDAQNNWSDIREFTHNGWDFSTGHAAVTADGRTLYFVSDRPGGMGGTDIYRSHLADEGWSAPENLGAPINSRGDEMFPTLFGDTLFFASNGHPGLGGLDIFRTVPEGEGWSTPENLGWPINTAADDFALSLLPGGREGYLSSTRGGSDRVYALRVKDPRLTARGTVRDAATGAPLAGVEVKLTDLALESSTRQRTGADGSYAFPLKPGREYRITGAGEGRFATGHDLSTRDQRHPREWALDIALEPVVVDKPIRVEIYYDLDRWDIRPEAAVELEQLVRLFTDNPGLSFELGSHTDSRASDLYNLVLSEARANSAVDYLIRRGVDPDRVAAKGYGERHPVNHCVDGVECDEELHQANRRTEIKVTGVGGTQP